ncbi:hypothetical protein DER44DRAFT_742116 [Fusarium oxysporum]|nr:hypothetical protein DER44DRAFT_742116 [Fusarium oxysporum]
MTYGYDSVIFKLLHGANFSIITSEGTSLLNALNESFLKASEAVADLRAIVDSTFSLIFFGTPHRGSSTAEFGQTVAEIVSNLTLTRYNANILGNLKQNTEILTKLRSDFESYLTHIAQRNRFEFTTFQKNRGISSIKGLSGKVVTDDSSELGQHDRKYHIEKNHMDMCKFFGASDPEYDKVAGEINRHILRLRQGTDEIGASE